MCRYLEMGPFYSMLVLYAVTHLTVLISASPSIPVLDSTGIQHLLGNTCPNFAEIIDGKDGMANGGEDMNKGKVFKGIDGVASGQPNPTTKPSSTVIDEVSGPITPRATLDARNAKPEPTILGVLTPKPLFGLGGPTTDVTPIVNSAVSEAAIIAAKSISQLSQNFSSSILALQVSASSVISQANETAQMALQASSSANQAAAVAGSSLASIQASASSAMAEASAQVQSALAGAAAASISASQAVLQAGASVNSVIGLATDAASSASLQAAAKVSSANDRAEQQINISQTQAETTMKIVLAAIISVIGTAFVSSLGFYLISRRRKRKYHRDHREEDNFRSSRGPGHDHLSEKRDSYHSYDSRQDKQRPVDACSVVRTPSPKFREEFSIDEQRKSPSGHEKKQLVQTAHEMIDDKDSNEKEVVVSTSDLISIKQASQPTERNVDEAAGKLQENTDRINSTEAAGANVAETIYPSPSKTSGELRNKHITPTFVSKHDSKKRTSTLPIGWFSGIKSDDAPVRSTGNIGVAS